MKIKFLKLLTALLFLSTAGGAIADQAGNDGTDSAMQNALNSSIRSDKDKARDASRKPAETLAFFEIKPDSKVLELMPGGGWYTKILGNYLKDRGALFVALGASEERLGLEENNLQHVKIIGTEFELQSSGQRGKRNARGESFGEDGFDAVLTFRNMHNLTIEGRAVINRAVLKALKPGGIYGVIDHTRRHMQGDSEELWRREDPVQLIKEMVQTGFEFVDYSSIHARPDDGLIYDSTHESINRDSDRFTLKFRKPE